MMPTSGSSPPRTTAPLRTGPSGKVTMALLARSIRCCVVRPGPSPWRRTPEPKPRRGHGLPNGGPYAAPAVLTLTVLAPTRSTALMYAFCKSAIMETDKPSAGFVERVPTRPVTGQSWRRKTCRSMLPGRRASLGPERLERFLVLIEQPRLDDPVVFDP